MERMAKSYRIKNIRAKPPTKHQQLCHKISDTVKTNTRYRWKYTDGYVPCLCDSVFDIRLISVLLNIALKQWVILSTTFRNLSLWLYHSLSLISLMLVPNDQADNTLKLFQARAIPQCWPSHGRIYVPSGFNVLRTGSGVWVIDIQGLY